MQESLDSTSSPSVLVVDEEHDLVHRKDGAAGREEDERGPPTIDRSRLEAIFDVDGVIPSSAVLTHRSLVFLRRREAELAYEREQRLRWDGLVLLLDLASRTLEAFELHTARDESQSSTGKNQPSTTRHAPRALLPGNELAFNNDDDESDQGHLDSWLPALPLGDAPWVHNVAGAVQATIDFAKHREAMEQLAAAGRFRAGQAASQAMVAAESEDEDAVMTDTVHAEALLDETDARGSSRAAHLASLCDELQHALQAQPNDDDNRQEERHRLCRFSQDGAVLESVDVLALVRLARSVLASVEAAVSELGAETPLDGLSDTDARSTENANFTKPQESPIEHHDSRQRHQVNENNSSPMLLPPGLSLPATEELPECLLARASSSPASDSNVVCQSVGNVHGRSSPRGALDELPVAANSVSEVFVGNVAAGQENAHAAHAHGMGSKWQAAPTIMLKAQRSNERTFNSMEQAPEGDVVATELELDSKFCAHARTQGYGAVAVGDLLEKWICLVHVAHLTLATLGIFAGVVLRAKHIVSRV